MTKPALPAVTARSTSSTALSLEVGEVEPFERSGIERIHLPARKRWGCPRAMSSDSARARTSGSSSISLTSPYVGGGSARSRHAGRGRSRRRWRRVESPSISAAAARPRAGRNRVEGGRPDTDHLRLAPHGADPEALEDFEDATSGAESRHLVSSPRSRRRGCRRRVGSRESIEGFGEHPATDAPSQIVAGVHDGLEH